MKHKTKRKYIRFQVDPNTTAGICPLEKAKEGHAFIPEFTALVYTEAYGGCGLVVLHHPSIEEGRRLMVKCGELAPIAATVRWVNKLDEDVLRIGLEFDKGE